MKDDDRFKNDIKKTWIVVFLSRNYMNIHN